MVQFQILSGKQAGARWSARRFPVRIGRAAANDLCLEADGVWDRHAEVSLDPELGYLLTAQPTALLTVNHAPAQTVRLRNGDTIELGSARLQFWLDQVPQRGLRLREWIVWLVIAAICLGQVALVY